MKIRGKTVYVYDVEVFPNCFHCSIKHTKTKERFHFEISPRKNQYVELYKFFTNSEDKLFCGYNNIHYDNPIINYLIDKFNIYSLAPWNQICIDIKDLSDLIITSETSASWRKWKYAKNFETLDLLTMLFSQKLRVGLKEMQVTMKFRNVQEYDGDFQKPIPINEIDNMISYNDNDVDSTEELLFRCVDQIKLRLGIQKEYGVDVLSKDGMTIGMEILKQEYLKKTNKTWDQIKDLRSPCDTIDLEKVILPFIKFDTPILQDLLVKLKSMHNVDPGRKGIEYHFLLDGSEVSVGVGGIHTKNTPEIIIPKEDEMLLDSDVASLYPSLLIAYNFVPPHLGKAFLETYQNIRTERLIAKRNGDKIKNETLKLSLNGLSGNLQNEYSWVYSPESVMKIRMNGQLLLLMLTEKIIQAGGKIKQLNTDGVLYLFPKNKQEELNSILKEWEQLTKLELETDEFERFYQFAINDYIGVLKGYSEMHNSDLIKQKGMFISKVSLGKGMQAMIIPKALNEYFVNNIPIENTIKGSNDINDFITYQKVSKEFSVEYNGNLISHINRYYVSKLAPYLFKCKVKNGIRSGYINMLKGHGVKIVNDLNSITKFPNDIDYEYYIGECKKIINQFECKQLSLF